VTSSLGASEEVEATLTVEPAEAPGFTRAFSPATIDPGGVSRLTYTIDNGANAIDVESLAFNETFPAGLRVADPPNADNDCDATFNPGASDSSITFTGGSVAGRESCAISVDLQAFVAGPLETLSGPLSSSLPEAPGVEATLTVNEVPLSVAMTFEPPTIARREVSVLSYTLDNGAAIGATSVSLANTLPADVTLANPPNASTTCDGGVLTATAGGNRISYSGGVLAAPGADGAASNCTITVDVTSALAATYLNDAVDVTASLGDSVSPTALLTVEAAVAPGFTKAFLPDTVKPGEISTLTFTIDNMANTAAAGSLAFIDTLPNDMIVADPSNLSATCGGAVSAPAGGATLSLSGGNVAAGRTCTISVDVQPLSDGALQSLSSVLTSDLPPAPGAAATLTVTETPLVVTIAFDPPTIAQGGRSRLTWSLANDTAISATSIALSDNLSGGLGGLIVASDPDMQTSCNDDGVLTPLPEEQQPQANGSLVEFSDGALAGGASCVISVDVVSTRLGAQFNETDSVTSSLGVSAAAMASLMVERVSLNFSMAFSPATVEQGAISRLTYTIDNMANVAVQNLQFLDGFRTGELVVAADPEIQNNCGGTFEAVAGAGMVSLGGGEVGANRNCTISVDVRPLVAGELENISNSLSSFLEGLGLLVRASAARAMLTVEPAEAPGFEAAFSPATVDPGAVSRLTYTIDNTANAAILGSLAFTDDFPTGLVVADSPNVNNTCGDPDTFEPVAEAGTVSLGGGTVAAGQSCTISVDLRPLVSGPLEILSGELTMDLPLTAPGATATLTVNEAPLAVAMAFDPPTIGAGGVSTLTYTLSNNASNNVSVEATAVSLEDTLPDDVTVIAIADDQTTCTGDTLTADGATITFTGGALEAGADCAIAVDVTSATAVTTATDYPNSTESVTSSLGDSIAAEATLTVAPTEAPRFTAAFEAASVSGTVEPDPEPGDVVGLTYTINNRANTVDLGSLAFTDDFPDGLVVAAEPDASTTCGGTFEPVAEAGTVSLSGGTVAAGRICRISVNLRPLVSGQLETLSGELTMDLPLTAPGATATLTVSEAALAVTIAFDPPVIATNGVSTLTYTLSNNAAVEATAVLLEDTLPADVTVADPPNAETTCTDGALTAEVGADTITFGGALAAGADCMITVDVTSANAADYRHTMQNVTSSLGVSESAEATLMVEDVVMAPGFTAAFSPDTVDPGEISTLTYTIDNSDNAFALGSLAFTDDFPAGLVVAAEPDASTTCGGTFEPAAESGTVSLGGGTLAAGQSCTISVDVQAGIAGMLEILSGDLTSDLPDIVDIVEGATATLTVNEAPLAVTMAFDPPTIGEGGVSTLIYTLSNNAGNNAVVEATAVSLEDTLPDDVTVVAMADDQTTCAGDTLTADGATITFTGGALEAGADCTIAVDVTATTAASYPNETESVTSSLGASIAAEATLTVEQVVAPDFTAAFSPDTVDPGVAATLTYTIDNSDNAFVLGSLAFTDDFPAGLVVAPVEPDENNPPDVDNNCGGTLTADAGTGVVSLSGGEVGASGQCTISVDLLALVSGPLETLSGELTMDLLPPAPGAAAMLTVNEVPLAVTMAFDPPAIGLNGVSALTYTLTNNALAEAASIMLFDRLPDDFLLDSTIDFEEDCGVETGFRFVPILNEITIGSSGGFTLAAGATCMISFDVTSVRAGMHTNDMATEMESVTSSLGASALPPAILEVGGVAAPRFSAAFDPAEIDQGGIAGLTFEIDNTANGSIGLEQLTFINNLPAGLLVADAPNRSTTCGGALTAAAGSGTMSLGEGEVGAGQICTVSVDVQALQVGAPEIESGDLSATATVPGAEPDAEPTIIQTTAPGAGATLTVNPPQAPGFASVFSPATVSQGDTSTLTFTIDNTVNLIDAGSLAFTADFPDGMAVAPEPEVQNDCGGAFDPVAGATALAFTGGSVAAEQICTISVQVQALEAGVLQSVSGDLASGLSDVTPGVVATLTVSQASLAVAMAFDPPAIAEGGVSRLIYTLNNRTAIGATAVSLSDTLPDDVTVADPPNESTICGGSFAPVAGGDTITFTGGALAANAECMITVDVTSATVGSYTNDMAMESESVTSSLGDGAVAEATLTVEPIVAPGFTAEFSPATIDPGGISTLTFTIDNTANLIDAGSLAFEDAFPQGMVVAPEPEAQNDCGGTFAPVAGDTALAFTGGSVAAGQSCTISVAVRALVSGSLPTVSGDLASDLPDTVDAAPGAAATLTVNEVPLEVTMAFDQTPIGLNADSMLTYTLSNGAAVAATAVSLSDMLPANVVVAPDPNVEATCLGDTLTAVPETAMITFTGGTLAVDADCTITVGVTSATAGSYLNETESVTSSLGASAPAEATLNVDEVAVAPGFVRVFDANEIRQGGETQVVFTIDNGANAMDITGMAFADALPTGVSVAATPGIINTCGDDDTFTPGEGDTTLDFTDGVLAAGETCELRVTVRAIAAGALTGPAVTLTSNLATATAAATTLTIDPAETPGFTKAFNPATVDLGVVSTLTFTIGNADNLIDVGSLAFTDTFPAGMVVAAPADAATTCGDGVVSATVGGDRVSLDAGSVEAGQSCTISVNIQALRSGALENISGDLTSDLPDAAPGAEATLTVNQVPLSVSIAFEPAAIIQNSPSTLRYTLANNAVIGATAVSLSDMLPTGVSVVTIGPPDITNTCGGTFSPVAGATTLAFTGGALAAGETCVITVDVTSAIAGTYAGATQSVTSSLGVSASATATLEVGEAAPLSVTMAFDPDTIVRRNPSTLTYELHNGAVIGVTAVALEDTLPDDVTVADLAATPICGGTLTADAGSNTITFTGGALAADETCVITVEDVTSGVVGIYTNTTQSVTSSLGASTATATLTVAAAPGFAKAFDPSAVDPDGISTLTFTIDNTANPIEVGSLAFTDALPDGMVVADPPAADNTCGGVFEPAASATSLTFSGGSVPAGASCTIAVDVQAQQAGTLENRSGALTSDLPVDTPGAEATLTVSEIPLTALMAFDPATIVRRNPSTLIYILINGEAIDATSVALSDTLPTDVTVADPPNASITGSGCADGALTADAGSNTITFTDGALDAGESCMISVDVTSATAGIYPNETTSVTSSLGASAVAEATLTVARASGFVKAFSPATVDPGDVSTLTFTIDNTANLIDVASLAFEDALPDGMVVAASPNADNTCDGAFDPAASATSLTFSGGSVAAGASCTLSVEVQALRAGPLDNVSGDLTSDLPVDTPGAEATLTVNEVPLTVSMAFDLPAIAQGDVSTLTYTLENGAAIGATSVALEDTLPADVTVAPTPNAETSDCGGAFDPVAGDTTLTFTGGALAAGAECTITVDVTSVLAATYRNETESVTSSLGDSAAAEATLTVDPAAPLSVSMAFNPATIIQNNSSTLTYTLENGAAIGATEVSLSDMLPANVMLPDLAATPICGGTLTADTGSNALTFTGGALGAGETCMIAVDVTSAIVGSYPNETESVTSSLGASAAAEATLTVDATGAPGFTRVFAPDTIAQGGQTEVVFTIDNGANATAIAQLAFNDTLPTGVSVASADLSDNTNTCGGAGTFTPVFGATTLSFTGGLLSTLSAGATCQIRVVVRAIGAGALTGPAVILTSDAAPATAAEATLTVTPADAPGLPGTSIPPWSIRARSRR